MVAGGEQVNGGSPGKDSDFRTVSDRLHKTVLDGPSCVICTEQDSRLGVSPFPGQVVMGRVLVFKRNVQFVEEDLLDRIRAVGSEVVDCFVVVAPPSRDSDVLFQPLGWFIVSPVYDTALGQGGVA